MLLVAEVYATIVPYKPRTTDVSPLGGVLRGHDLHGVTELLELPLPIKCARGSFDADKARLQFAKDRQQLFAADPTYQYRASLAVDTVQLEDILCQVDTEYVNFHC